MASEPIGQGMVYGDQSELNKIDYSEVAGVGTVLVKDEVENIVAEIKGTQRWKGDEVSESLFKLMAPGSASAALFPASTSAFDNKLTIDLESSENTYQGSIARDSIRFGKETEKDVVNLGKSDGAADLVDIKSLKEVKRLTINEFGQNDSLRIGGKTYDYNKLQDTTFKNITIKFD